MPPTLSCSLSLFKVLSNMETTTITENVDCQSDLTWLSADGSVTNKTKVVSAGTQDCSKKSAPTSKVHQEKKPVSPSAGPNVSAKRQPSTTGAGPKAVFRSGMIFDVKNQLLTYFETTWLF